MRSRREFLGPFLSATAVYTRTEEVDALEANEDVLGNDVRG
jgi:hypothetical protein